MPRQNKIKYNSIKTWKQVRPNEKLIDCPTDDPLMKLVGAILSIAYEDEGINYFSEECRRHNDYFCGSFWIELAGLDVSYIKKKADEVHYTDGDNRFKRKTKRRNKFKKQRI